MTPRSPDALLDALREAVNRSLSGLRLVGIAHPPTFGEHGRIEVYGKAWVDLPSARTWAEVAFTASALRVPDEWIAYPAPALWCEALEPHVDIPARCGLRRGHFEGLHETSSGWRFATPPTGAHR